MSEHINDPVAPRIAVAQLGARRDYAVPRILQEADWLERFCTDLRPDLADIPPEKTSILPWLGVRRRLGRRLAGSPAKRLASYVKWNRAFGARVAAAGLGQANGLYVFNAAGLEIMRSAAGRLVRKFLDQTAAPWEADEKLLAEERARWQGWEYEGTTAADWQPLADRERAEWDLADVILCGSDHVVDAMRSVSGPTQKCVVVPYGVDPTRFRAVPEPLRGGPLHVLFMGTVQLRKGIPYLLEAAQLADTRNIEFRAVGPVRVSRGAARDIGRRIDLAGPVPRAAVPRAYGWADVVVLPSLSEGSANVVYEALAAGRPVITTRQAGGVVRDGAEGYLVPARSGEAIAEKLDRLASDRALLQRLSRGALERSRAFTLEAYAQRLRDVIAAAYD